MPRGAALVASLLAIWMWSSSAEAQRRASFIGQSPRWIVLEYPYDLGYPGVAVREDVVTTDRHLKAPGSEVLGVFDVGGGYVLDYVSHVRAAARIRMNGDFDLEARYGAYFTQDPDPVRGLGLGRIAGLIRFVGQDVVQLRFGVAGQVFHDADVRWGTAVVLDLDLYPCEPVVVHADFSFGDLDLSWMLDASATVGVQLERAELYVGYQLLVVAPNLPGGTFMHGPIAGFRLWAS